MMVCEKLTVKREIESVLDTPSYEKNNCRNNYGTKR